ncbi:MAG: serine/threonine-protein kinase [Myxococcota bacterium]
MQAKTHISSGGLAAICPGGVLGERYVIERVLFGADRSARRHRDPLLKVWDIAHPNQAFAVKLDLIPEGEGVLCQPLGASPLERSGALLSRLSHGGIVAFRECARFSGRVALVTEWLDGRALSEVITELSAADRLDAAIRLTEACVALHAAGVVHRDIKPRNVLWSSRRGAVLVDFDLATTIGDPQVASGGTPGWSAPEQLIGGCGWLDGRADLYALGAVLVYLFTGQRPFPRDAPLRAQLRPTDHLPWHAQLAPQLRPLIDGLLAPQRRDRYQNAAEVLAELQMFKSTGSFWDTTPPTRPSSTEPRLSDTQPLSPTAARARLAARLPLLSAQTLAAMTDAAARQGSVIDAAAEMLADELIATPALPDEDVLIDWGRRFSRFGLAIARDEPEPLARAALAAGRLNHALQAAGRAKDTAAAQCILARIHIQSQDIEAAKQHIAQAMVLKPNREEARVLQAAVALDQGDLALARRILDDLSPVSSAALAEERMSLELQLGRPLQALTCGFADEARLLPALIDAMTRALRDDHHRRGEIERALSRRPDAWVALGVAIMRHLSSPLPDDDMLRTHLESICVRLAALDDTRGRCLRLLTAGLSGRSVTATLLNALKDGEINLADLPALLDWPFFDLISANDPVPAEACAMALLLRRLGASAVAAAFVSPLVADHPRRANTLGRIALMLGDPAGAMRWLRNDPGWLSGLAQCAAGDTESGLTRLKKYFEQKPSMERGRWLCRGLILSAAPRFCLSIAGPLWRRHGPQDVLIEPMLWGLIADGRIQTALELAARAKPFVPERWVTARLTAALRWCVFTDGAGHDAAAEALTQLGRLDGMAEAMERQWRRQPSAARLERLALALQQDGEPDEAIERCARARASFGADTALDALLARQLLLADRPLQALTALGEGGPPHLRREALLAAGRFDAVIAQLRDTDASDASSRLHLTVALSETGQAEQASALADALMQDAPRHPGQLLSVLAQTPDRRLDHWLTVWRDQPAAPQERLMILLIDAQRALDTGEPDRAYPAAAKALALDRQRPACWTMLMDVAEALGSAWRWAELRRAAQQQAPAGLTARLQLATQEHPTIEDIQAALREAPDDLRGWRALARWGLSTRQPALCVMAIEGMQAHGAPAETVSRWTVLASALQSTDAQRPGEEDAAPLVRAAISVAGGIPEKANRLVDDRTVLPDAEVIWALSGFPTARRASFWYHLTEAAAEPLQWLGMLMALATGDTLRCAKLAQATPSRRILLLWALAAHQTKDSDTVERALSQIGGDRADATRALLALRSKMWRAAR